MAMLVVAQMVVAQGGNWSSANIADSLKDKNHNSVVRCYDVDFVQTGIGSGICNYRRVVTVLNKKGDDAALWSDYEDRYRSITSFRGRMLDASANVQGKFKRSDLHLSGDYANFASDTKMLYYAPPTALSYPYTVEFEWQVKVSDGLRCYPNFSPMDDERQSMQECHYTLTLPADAEISERQMNMNVVRESSAVGKMVKHRWTAPARCGIILEDYSPKAIYQYPSIRVNPPAFTMEGTECRLDSWESMGSWLYSIADGRDELPQSEIDKVKSVVSGLTDRRAIVEAIYRYHGEKTRYVSIQLGIGGYQPMPAAEVSKTGFGDCKALSNYMKALLKAVGIESNLVAISTKYADLLPDFPNFYQLNHVILCVPDAADTLWIDGTATSSLPFGYIPPALAGHECLMETRDGGKLVRVPDYPAEVDVESVVTELFFNDDFSLRDAIYKVHASGSFYAKYLSMSKAEAKLQADAVLRKIGANGCRLSDLMFADASSDVHRMNLQCHFTASYGKVSGSRLFVPVFNSGGVSVPKFKDGRTMPIVQYASVAYVDTVLIHIPDGLEIESLPKWMTQTDGASDLIENDFGSIQASATVTDGNLVTVVAKFTRKACELPIGRKDDVVALLKAANGIYNDKIVLKRR